MRPSVPLQRREGRLLTRDGGCGMSTLDCGLYQCRPLYWRTLPACQVSPGPATTPGGTTVYSSSLHSSDSSEGFYSLPFNIKYPSQPHPAYQIYKNLFIFVRIFFRKMISDSLGEKRQTDRHVPQHPVMENPSVPS